MNKIFISLFLTIFLVITGCTSQKTTTKSKSTPTPVKQNQSNKNKINKQKMNKTYTMEEISKHSQSGDCWLLINDKIYDVSSFKTHPGGEAMLQGCGKDATKLFETRPMGSGTAHSKKARENLDSFYIGDLSQLKTN